MDKELANEICIFISKDMPGIKFYDRTPSEEEQEFSGEFPEGVFQTDRYSISKVEWDEEMNEPNATRLIHYRDVSNTVRTYMVSAEKFQEILGAISSVKNTGNEYIIIDTREPEKEKTNGRESRNY